MGQSSVLTSQQYSSALADALRADVTISAPTGARTHEFRYFESGWADVLKASGDPMHIQNSPADSDAVFVLRLRRGNCLIQHKLGSTQLREGEFAVFNGSHAATVVHRLAFEAVGIRFPERALAELFPEWSLAEFLAFDATRAEARTLFDVAEELLETGPQLRPRSVASLASTLLTLLHQSLISQEFGRAIPETNYEYQIRRVKQFCRRNLSDPDLGIDFIGRSLGVSRAQLHRLFKNQSTTLMAWVQDQRLVECKRSLEHSSNVQTLSEIALAAGFRSGAHFSRAYRDRFGFAPSESRNSSRQHTSRHEVAMLKA